MIQEGDTVRFHEIISGQFLNEYTKKDDTHYIEQWMNIHKLDRSELILYEDDNRLVWNKPVGIVAHEWNKHTEDITMNQLLAYYIIKIAKPNTNAAWKYGEWGETFKPAFAFRLDKDTSGVLVSAKTYPALQHINALIREHDIHKEYLAITSGNYDLQALSKKWYAIDNDGFLIINDPLFKWYSSNSGRAHVFINSEKGLDSTTKIHLENSSYHEQLWEVSLIHCILETGRMHQIRAHLAHIWLVIIWDIQYGLPAINRIAHKFEHIDRQLLHSYRYEFQDLDGKTISVMAPIPDEFNRIIK